MFQRIFSILSLLILIAPFAQASELTTYFTNNEGKDLSGQVQWFIREAGSSDPEEITSKCKPYLELKLPKAQKTPVKCEVNSLSDIFREATSYELYAKFVSPSITLTSEITPYKSNTKLKVMSEDDCSSCGVSGALCYQDSCLGKGKCVFKGGGLLGGECKSCSEMNFVVCSDYYGEYLDQCEKSPCLYGKCKKSEDGLCVFDCSKINSCRDYPFMYCAKNPCSKGNCHMWGKECKDCKNIACKDYSIDDCEKNPCELDGRCAMINSVCSEAKRDLKITLSQENAIPPYASAELSNTYPESTGCSIDWGDGTKKDISVYDAKPQHFYLANGEYEVTYSCKVGDAEKSAQSSITINSPALEPRDKLKVLIVQVVPEGKVANRKYFEKAADLAKEAIKTIILADCPDKLEAIVSSTDCIVDVGDVEKNAEKKMADCNSGSDQACKDVTKLFYECTNLYKKSVKDCANMASSDYVIALKEGHSICAYGGLSGNPVFSVIGETLPIGFKSNIAHELGHNLGTNDEYYDNCRCHEQFTGEKSPFYEANCLDSNLGGSDPYGSYDSSYCAGGSNCPGTFMITCNGNYNAWGDARCLMGCSGLWGDKPSFCTHCQSVLKKRLSIILPGCGK